MCIKKGFLVVAICAVASVLASCSEPESGSGFSFVVLGDTAYKTPEDYPAYDALIDRINQTKPKFTIHVGDVLGHAGCHNEIFQRVKADFGKFERPLIYTPGDNEWTDCHAEAAGSYDPVERLAKIRRDFFSHPISLGQTVLPLTRQSVSGTGVENALWWQSEVLFATVHIVGSNNGLRQDHQDPNSEFVQRNTANQQWLKQVFAQAVGKKAKAVVLAYHAGMFTPPMTPDGFAGVRPLIGKLSAEFRGPVLLVHGDHHEFVIDRPYLQGAGVSPLGNITRLQTYGWPDAKAVKIHVDTSTEGVFSFETLFAGDGWYPGGVQ